MRELTNPNNKNIFYNGQYILLVENDNNVHEVPFERE